MYGPYPFNGGWWGHPTYPPMSPPIDPSAITPDIQARATVLAFKMAKKDEKRRKKAEEAAAKKKKEEEDAKKPKPTTYNRLELMGMLTLFGPIVTISYCLLIRYTLSGVASILSSLPLQ